MKRISALLCNCLMQHVPPLTESFYSLLICILQSAVYWSCACMQLCAIRASAACSTNRGMKPSVKLTKRDLIVNICPNTPSLFWSKQAQLTQLSGCVMWFIPSPAWAARSHSCQGDFSGSVPTGTIARHEFSLHLWISSVAAINESIPFQGHLVNIGLPSVYMYTAVCMLAWCCFVLWGVLMPNNGLGCSLGPWQLRTIGTLWDYGDPWLSLTSFALSHNASQQWQSE